MKHLFPIAALLIVFGIVAVSSSEANVTKKDVPVVVKIQSSGVDAIAKALSYDPLLPATIVLPEVEKDYAVFQIQLFDVKVKHWCLNSDRAPPKIRTV